jgi:O-antigen ligase
MSPFERPTRSDLQGFTEGWSPLNIIAPGRRWTELPLSTGVVLVTAFVLAPLLVWAGATESWKVFALLVGVAAIPVVIRWPVVLTLGFYALLLPFENVVGLDGGATLARFVGMLAGGVLLVVGLKDGRLVCPPSVAFWWGALVLWGGLSVTWAVNVDVAMGRLPSAISLFMLFLVATSFRVSRSELNGVLILIVVGAVAAATAGYVSGVDHLETGRRGGLVLGGDRINPNGFAASLLPGTALVIAGFLKLRGLVVKTAALAAIAVLGVGIYISMSRAALLALIVIICVLVYRMRVSRWYALIIILVLVGLLGLMPERFFTRVTGPVTGEDATGSGRTEIWSIGLKALDEFSIWGAGLSNFPTVYARYTPVPPGDSAKAAHNMYLSTWVDLGIVGFGIMLVAITSQLLVAWRARHSGSLVLYAIEACLLGHLVYAFFGEPLWDKRQWLLCILMVWAARLATEWAPAPERQSVGAGLRSADLSIPRPV